MNTVKTTNKDMNKLLKQLKKLGWVVEYNGSKHVKVVNLHGEFVVVSNTCSDHRGMLNARADLRRIGAPF